MDDVSFWSPLGTEAGHIEIVEVPSRMGHVIFEKVNGPQFSKDAGLG